MKMLVFDFRESEKEFFQNANLIDFEITFIKEPLNKKTFLTDEQLKETDIISVFATSSLSARVLDKFHNLRIISTRSTTFAHIDIDYCTSRGITVLNVEDYGAKGIAQYTISLAIALARNLLPAYLGMKNHKINYSLFEGRNLNSMTIGIVGCGNVGIEVAKIAKYLGMKVLMYSYMQNPEVHGKCDFVSFDELLKNSDIITLHVPYLGDNYHVIGREEFEKMKDGIYIINTSRGEILDISALYENIVSGKIKGAGLDVLECEFFTTHPEELIKAINTSPCVSTAMIAHKLFKLPNVIITPHLAYNTTESINFVLEKTFNKIRDFMKGMYVDKVC